MAERRGAAERQPGDGAQVILELAGDGALDGPVSRVVHAWREFIGDQAAVAYEKFDRQCAGIAEIAQHGAQMSARLAFERGRFPRRDAQAQDAAGVPVARQRIVRLTPVACPYAQRRNLQIEIDELLVQERSAAERLPGFVEIGALADHGLSLAVVAKPPGLEHTGQADAFAGALQRCAAGDCGVARRRNAQALEQPLFRQPVLAYAECTERWTDARVQSARGGAERCNRNILPVETQHLAAPCQAPQQRAIGELADQERRQRGGRNVRAAIEEQEIEPQRITGEREHAAKLARTHDANGHAAGVRGSG